jgi:DNA-3-methyladenine glycosylase I
MSKQLIISDWVYKKKRPSTDVEYFSNLTRVIFQAGLNWTMINNKWPNFKKAFDNFNIDKIAKYGLKDQKCLLKNTGIVRNKNKIVSTVENAKEFLRIRKEFGSFQEWLDSLDKTGNYKEVVKILRSRFKHVGPTTANIFIWSVGEPIKRD